MHIQIRRFAYPLLWLALQPALGAYLLIKETLTTTAGDKVVHATRAIAIKGERMRIEVVQDIDILDGAPHLRITHLEIDTRLVGRAELTIRERYCGPIAGETTQGGLSDDELACSTAP